MSTADQEHLKKLEYMWRLRGVRKPCERCQGRGCYEYGNTSTWRGGMGGAAITTDVCDKCWGTGCQYRTGMNLLKLISERRKATELEHKQWLATYLGIEFKHLRPFVLMLAEFAEKQANKRKFPAWSDPVTWVSSWTNMANLIRTLVREQDQ